EIIDYKCFKNFKIDELSQINIISGKNNVGKTALLELLFIQNDVPACTLNVIAQNRNIKKEYFQAYLKNIKYSFIADGYITKYGIKSKKDLNKQEIEQKDKLNGDYDEFQCVYYGKNLALTPLVNIEMEDYNRYKYINSSKPSNEKLVKLYSKIQSLGLQHKFLTYLQLLDENIKWLEPQLINDELVLRVNLANPEISLITSELGEGVNRYIEILASMLSIEIQDNKWGKSIFIDEIENGIHYSKLLDIAKAIIEISEKEDIQVFITTHDKETIEAFAKASKEVNFKDISSIRLIKDENHKIVPIVRQYDNFAYGINRGADMR
ncbi:MAG: AAA family ATPase, partial [Campylobacterota bacterium]|nr:AAA family ATPase [Campylobacterota bacterium]